MSAIIHDRKSDSALIAQVAREVVRRLKEAGPESTAATAEGLVTLATLQRYTNTKTIELSAGAVVTPAAKDEAARQGIVFRDAAGTSSSADTAGSSTRSAPASSPACPLLEQLGRRGVALPAGLKVVWTDQPAAEVYRRCSRGERAVMLNSITDVDRFAEQLAPNTWVLDKLKLNLIAATNVCVRIARASHRSNGGSS